MDGVKSKHAIFADDVTLLAARRQQLISVISDVRSKLTKHCQILHMDKCLVQTNRPGFAIVPIRVGGVEMPMVRAYVAFRVLGSQFRLTGRCSTEVQARVAAAWSNLHSLLQLLRKKDGNLNEKR